MNVHTITKGYDIRMVGAATRDVASAPEPLVVAIDATEFPGIKAKLLVKEGDAVKTGDPLFFDKNDPDVAWLSPATGKVLSLIHI